MTSRPSRWPPRPHRSVRDLLDPQSTVALVLGQGPCERWLEAAEQLIIDYRNDDGLRYLNYKPVGNPNVLVPDDLAVTTLVNSRFTATAFKSVQDHGHEVDLASLPEVGLEHTSDAQRQRVADLVTQVAQWPGFAASVATKMLHKKRPWLIPILDNQAIFGAYMNPSWPEQRSRTESVKSATRIREALDWITHDLTRAENTAAWEQLASLEPTRSGIQLFDMVWWIHFRRVEPVSPVQAS